MLELPPDHGVPLVQSEGQVPVAPNPLQHTQEPCRHAHRSDDDVQRRGGGLE